MKKAKGEETSSSGSSEEYYGKREAKRYHRYDKIFAKMQREKKRNPGLQDPRDRIAQMIVKDSEMAQVRHK